MTIQKYQHGVLTSLVLLSLCICGSGVKQDSLQTESEFNEGWRFKRLEYVDLEDVILASPSFDDADWETVTLPHTAHVEPYVTAGQWQGICWYRNSFEVDGQANDKIRLLRLDGAMNVADVWINGIHAATHLGGFLPVVVDMTHYLTEGSNTIAVRLDNRDNPITGPKPVATLDFNIYSGLYRNAWLVTKDRLHITDPILANKPGSGGVFVTYPSVGKESAVARVQVHVRNSHNDSRKFRIVNVITRNGCVVARGTSDPVELESGTDCETTMDITVSSPELWSTSSPELYELVTWIEEGNNAIGRMETTIGFRTVEFCGQELYVNGERTFLRGVNRHQDYPFIGYAMSDNAHWRDAVKIKEAGFDYVRFSHYPHSPAFIDACNRIGLFVLDAIPGWQYINDDPRFADQVEQTARDMIRRDRNNPCVLAWEVSLNETWMSEAFIDRLIATAREEYPSGCITAGWMGYGYDIYLEARQHRLGHEAEVTKPYNVSEYGDWEYYAQNAGFTQDKWADLKEDERTSRQLLETGEKRLLQQATNIQEAHNDNLGTPAHADGYWVMFDYNRGYAPDLEASGIASIDRRPKFGYYFFRSQRSAAGSDGVMVYIANYWKEDSTKDIRVFSNAEEVELWLNGQSVGRQKPDRGRISDNLAHPPFTFPVPAFEEGTLQAVAYVGGKEAARHVVRTPQAPAILAVNVDESGIPVGTNDVLIALAEVKDKNGTVVPDAPGSVRFTVSGDALLVGDNPALVKAGAASVVIKTLPGAKNFSISASYRDPGNQLIQDSISIDVILLMR